MNPITFHLTMLNGLDGHMEGVGANASQQQRTELLLTLLEALVAINQKFLSARPHTPSLAMSGTRYRAENHDTDWRDIGGVLEDGYGDIEDLSAWIVAESRTKGLHASFSILWDNNELYWISVTISNISVRPVQTPDGINFQP